LIVESKTLFRHMDNFSDRKILVIGDLILDEFIWGKVRRISPEAPVPVVEVERESLRLGGSANVVNNLKALGCKVALSGVMGNDSNGDRLRDLLEDMDVNCEGVIIKDNRPTAIKTRVIAQHQQIVRFDRERSIPIKESTTKSILAYLKDNLGDIDAVIISDYGKGVISKKLLHRALPEIAGRGIPIAVDPKPVNFPYYKGVTVTTPNHHEAAAAADTETDSEKGLAGAAQKLLAKNKAKSILITRGENGMSLFESDGQVTHIPTVARDVYDVTGAGDTVIATMALSIASGATLKEAALMANHAAGIVVGKLGTATTTVEELKAAINGEEIQGA